MDHEKGAWVMAKVRMRTFGDLEGDLLEWMNKLEEYQKKKERGGGEGQEG